MDFLFRSLEQQCKIKIAASKKSIKDRIFYGLGGLALGTMLAVISQGAGGAAREAAKEAVKAAAREAAGGAAAEAAAEAKSQLASAAASLVTGAGMALAATARPK